MGKLLLDLIHELANDCLALNFGEMDACEEILSRRVIVIYPEKSGFG